MPAFCSAWKSLAGRSISLHDALGKQIPDGLALLWHIGGEDVIKAAVFADDDDDVFDRRLVSLSRDVAASDLGGSERVANGQLEDDVGYQSRAQPAWLWMRIALQSYFLLSRSLRAQPVPRNKSAID